MIRESAERNDFGKWPGKSENCKQQVDTARRGREREAKIYISQRIERKKEKGYIR